MVYLVDAKVDVDVDVDVAVETDVVAVDVDGVGDVLGKTKPLEERATLIFAPSPNCPGYS